MKDDTFSPYLLSEEASDSDESDFSFEIEEEIVHESNEKNCSIATTTKRQTKACNHDSTQPKYLHEIERKSDGKIDGKKGAAFKAEIVSNSDNDDVSLQDSTMSDDFSISVASETDGLVSAVESSTDSVKKSAVQRRQSDMSKGTNEKSKLIRRGKASDESTTSSKTAIQSLMEKLSSMGDANSTQEHVDKAKTVVSDSMTSSKFESLKSKAVGSIEIAESIVKTHGDIENVDSITPSNSSTSKNGSRLWGTPQKDADRTATQSRKRSSKRKICCIVGFVMVAAGATVGALIAFEIIFKGKIMPSSKPPEPETTTEMTSYGDSPWYVDWNSFKCVMDCNGRPPCGGTKLNDDESFATLELCCLVGMSIFIDEHWTSENCMSMTAIQTAIPTYSPTPGLNEETSVPTVGHQTSTSSSYNPPGMFYADFNTMKCVVEATSRKAEWEKGFERMSDCCGAYFGGDLYKTCLNEDEESTDPVLLYYPDYSARNCLEEDSSTKQSWEKGFDTKAECCDFNFIWDKSSICYRGEEGVDTVIPTSTPSAKPTAIPTAKPTAIPTTNSPSTRPTSSPINSPTLQPTLKPSSLSPTLSPSKTPTASPVIPGSPTRSPIVSPSSSPSSLPSTFPTVAPSVSHVPTVKPSLTPSVTPTAPTSSPTGELEVLRTTLVTRSPTSSDNLFIESSDQYLAMEWLLGNTMFASYPDERKIQRWALSTLFYSLYGTDWTINNGWLSHNGNLEHECTWHGISCSSSGTIISINLKANRVDGHFPDEIVLLVDIEYLGLSENKIRSIPSSLISLPNLKVLDLHKNRIREIPDGDYGASRMEELYLSYNGISSIPNTFFQLRFLKVLWLANNGISAPLSGFGKMTLLEELDLESNQFYGPIPEEMFGLSNLSVLYLYENELTGQIPPGLSQLTSLTALDLHSNQIEGQIPAEIGSFSMLSELYLGNNKIGGQIPSQLYKVTSLTVLDISENYLNSTLGSGIGNLNQLTKLDLHDNYKKSGGEVESYGIYGSIPETIGSLTQLKELRLDNNYVSSTLPPAIGDLTNLEILRLESNNFHGSIKPVANAKNLRYVHLWSNYFSGPISSRIGQLSQVVELFLDDNEFTGFIPSELGSLSNAKYIALGTNELEGVIPPSFGMLASLERLDLQGNNLTGEVPAELGNIQSLERIRLEGNQLFGDIPKAICNSGSLEFLSGNCETIADSTIQNSYWWSCNCCTVCDEG